MAAEWSFDPGIVLDDVTLEPQVSTTGIFTLAVGGAAEPVYDLNGSPITNLTSNALGYVARFRADDPVGFINFGSVWQPVVAYEVFVNAASIAALTAAAEAAADAAEAAQAAAELAAAGGSGGLPAGTTLETIPNGVTRLAFSQTERDKLTGVAVGATRLLIGTAAGTAKSGDYAPTPAQIGAVTNASGVPRLWGRTAAQGLPSTADGALDGDIAFMDAP